MVPARRWNGGVAVVKGLCFITVLLSRSWIRIQFVRRLARVGQHTQSLLPLPHPPPVRSNGLIGQTGVSFHSLLMEIQRREADFFQNSFLALN